MSLPFPSDTIAAIATAPGEAAIAVVRLSGPDAHAIVERLASPPAGALPSPGGAPSVRFVRIHSPAGECLDDALLLSFYAPRSYTGEDAAEIQCHGGAQAAPRILAAVLAAGARMAEPGEFTKRAFLNGKLNLTQAEAVLDLIHARSERAARMATAQLGNALGRRILALYDRLVAVSADTEAMLDFPDDELPQEVPLEIRNRISSLTAEVRSLLSTWQEGRLLRDGGAIVLAGAPNTGKSTLLNRLAGHDRAIVSPIPGTTRDTIEEAISLRGYPLRVMDTAGLRDSADAIEQEGMRRTRQATAAADVIVVLLDVTASPTPAETAFFTDSDPAKTIIVANKMDLLPPGAPVPAVWRALIPSAWTLIPLSARHSEDLSALTDEILRKWIRPSADISEAGNLAVSERHKMFLMVALEELTNAETRLSGGMEADFLPAATHLASAVEAVGGLFGKNCTEDMLDQLFSRFCVGK